MNEWVPIIIAILALAATFWQAKLSRDHNKKSVLPILMGHEDWQYDPEGLVVSLTLENVGIGIAMVTDRYFIYESQRFIPTKDNRSVQELLSRLFNSSINYELLACKLFSKSSSIPPGAQYTILKIRFPKAHPSLREVVEELFSKADLVVKYESLYKEQFTYHSGE